LHGNIPITTLFSYLYIEASLLEKKGGLSHLLGELSLPMPPNNAFQSVESVESVES
jgi:hypothetical protein